MKTSKFDAPHWRRELQIVDEMYESDEFRMPVHYVLSLTNECNLRCPFCFLEKLEGEKTMTGEDWLEVLSQIPDYARVILFGGEPMLFRDFEMVYNKAAEGFRCTIVTNGTLLTAEAIEMLLSKDGLCDLDVSVDTMRNWNRNFTVSEWERLMGGVRLFNERRKAVSNPPKLGINVVLLDESVDELYELHRFANEELQCDYVNYCLLNGAPMQLSDTMRPFEEVYTEVVPPIYEKWPRIIDEIEKIREYDLKNGCISYLRPKIIDINTDAPTSKLSILNDREFHKQRFGVCKMPWADCRVFADGNVTACLSVSFGNFKQTRDLRTILTSPVAKRFRQELKECGFFPQCNRCAFLYDKDFEQASATTYGEGGRR
jgi:MoaA/NifB/PqqE/SkfB family radical SAM enzyme